MHAARGELAHAARQRGELVQEWRWAWIRGQLTDSGVGQRLLAVARTVLAARLELLEEPVRAERTEGACRGFESSAGEIRRESASER